MATVVSQVVQKNQTEEEYQIQFPAARAIVNIYAKANEDLNLWWRWKQGNGIAKDLRAYYAKMSIRERKDGQINVATCSTDPNEDGVQGTINLDGSGNIKIVLNHNYIRELYKSGTWVYDLLLTDQEGITTRLVEGYFYIDRGVTQNNSAGANGEASGGNAMTG